MHTRSFLLGLSLAIAFISGNLSSSCSTSDAQAHTPSNWEYRCLPGAIGAQEQAANANTLGAEGWELVTSTGENVWCFKRPL